MEDLKNPLILEIGLGFATADLDSILSSLPADAIRKASCYVFRVDVDFLLRSMRDSAALARAQVCRRAAGRPVYLINLSQDMTEHALWELAPQGVLPHSNPKVLKTIRRHHLASILGPVRHEAELQGTESYHFVTPSLGHVERFLRVAEVVRSRASLDAIAFWLAPIVIRSGGIVLDTGAIFSLIFNTFRQLGASRPVEAFSSHPLVDPRSAERTLEALVRAVPRDKRLLGVVSVMGSGNGIRTAEEILRLRISRGIGIDWVALYGYADCSKDAEVLCCLDEPNPSYASKEECSFCRDRSVPLEVDPATFFLRNPEEKTVALRAEHLDPGRKFIDGYGDYPEVLRVHRDDPNDGRHHAFDIDVLTLMGVDLFRQRLLKKLHEMPWKPEQIVVPDHEAGIALGTVAKEVLQSPLTVSNSLAPETLSSEERARLLAAKSIIILDDVINSGSRLERYNVSLRNHHGNLERVGFLVGVARPESPQELRRIEISLTSNHAWQTDLWMIEMLPLPRWSSADCPWCAEYKLLSAVSSRRVHPPDWLTERMLRLTERVRGICEAPLLILPGCGEPPLGSQSRIAGEGARAVAVVFAIASGLQRLRNDKKRTRRLEQKFPVLTRFAKRNLGNYSEDLVRACLLRLVRPEEWEHSVRSQPQGIFHRYFQHDAFGWGEFMLAMGRRSVLPWFDRSMFEKAEDITSLDGEEIKKLTRVAG